ncbi:MAG: glycerol kinase [Eubacterium sp.]|nr:glycerol kinase [Eubacterium sp.]
MKKYFLIIDEGTTGTRAVIYDKQFRAVSYTYTEITQYMPKEDIVEHDFEEIYEKSVAVCREAMQKAGILPEEIIAMGITNQRNTQCVWDRKTGKPLLKGIVWQDTRTRKLLDEMRRMDCIRMHEVRHCGRRYVVNSSPVTLRWIMDHRPDIAEKMTAGEAAFGSVDTWLVWKFTGGRVHAMTYSNASSLGIYDMIEDCWCAPVFEGTGVPMSVLPELYEEVSDFGTTDVFGAPIPITAVIGDQQASMFAQNCRSVGTVKCTNGTGTFMDINIGSKYVPPQTELAAMVAWSIHGQKTYLYERMLPVAGSAVQWLRDGLGVIKDAAESYDMAMSVPDTGGVLFVTSMSGVYAPAFDPYSRGTIFGIHKGTKKEHIVRATIEGIAFSLADVMDVVADQTGIAIKELKIDGGASKNDLLAQSFADFIRCKVVRPQESAGLTAAGAARLAAVGAGIYTLETLPETETETDKFYPMIDEETAKRKLSRYRDAVERAKAWMK